ncbi:hypothetical protein MY1884_008554 [Beauveria asiatica]
MPEALSKGEVIVTLSCLSPITLRFPQRRLLLSNRKNVIPIGRVSNRSATEESRKNNALIDAPVMSKKHAELRLDTQGQTVFIRDQHSLHGTFHNGVQLRAGQSQALRNGDVLKFGISIDRGHETFPQCIMKVSLEFGQVEPAPVTACLPQVTVFQVPDDTESEDSEGMDDIDSQAAFSSVANEEELHASASRLTENGLELSEFHGFNTSDPVDLTSEPDLISDGNNPSSSSPLSDGYYSTTQDAGHDADHDADYDANYTLRTVEPKDVNVGAQDCHSIPLLSDGFAPAQQFKEGLSVDITAGNTVPGMDGPLSEDQHLSPSSEIMPLLRVQSLGESSGKLDYFIAREQNKQYIQNAIVSGDAQAELTPPPQQEAARSLKDVESPLKEARGSSNTDELHEASASKTDEVEEVAYIKCVLKKRKADQIEPSPLEVYDDNSVMNASPAASSADQYGLPRNALANGDGSYAYKRVKTAAEYVGLMAIGGAAVMTALIATAPNF